MKANFPLLFQVLIDWQPAVDCTGCPLPGDTWVCVRLYGGSVNRTPVLAGQLDWTAVNDGGIKEYQVMSPLPEAAEIVEAFKKVVLSGNN